MRKTTSGLAALVAVGFGLAGCKSPQHGLDTRSTYTLPRTELATPDNVKGTELGRLTQKSTEFNLEYTVINGEVYSLGNNVMPENGELEGVLYKHAEGKLRLDRATKTATEVFPNVYVPTKEKKADGTDATRFTLLMEGPHAVRADITNFDVKDVERGVIRTNQNDFKISLAITNMWGRDFYTPAITEEARSPDDIRGNFYLIPVEGTVPEIDVNTGQVTLISREGIYGLHRWDSSLFNLRTSAKVELAELEAIKKAREAEEKEAEEREKLKPSPGQGVIER